MSYFDKLSMRVYENKLKHYYKLYQTVLQVLISVDIINSNKSIVHNYLYNKHLFNKCLIELSKLDLNNLVELPQLYPPHIQTTKQ